MDRGEIELAIGHQNAVCSIAFSSDGRVLVSGGRDGMVKLWDVPTCTLLRTLDSCWTGVDAVAISPDGKVVGATGGFEDPGGGILSEVRIWEADTGRLVRAIDEWVSDLAFSPGGEELYGFSSSGIDPTAEEGRPTWDLSGVASPEVIAWDPGTGEERARLAASDERARASWRRKSEGGVPGDSLVLTPEGSIALRVVDSPEFEVGTLQLFDARQDVLLWEHTLRGDVFLCAAISPDGSRVASGGRRGVVRLHDPRDGRVAEGRTGHEGWVRALAFSPDGRLLASAGDDGTVRLGDVGHPVADGQKPSISPPACSSSSQN